MVGGLRYGRGGNIAPSELVANSKFDGYKRCINTVGTHAINPAIYAKLNFDPPQDFTAITTLIKSEWVKWAKVVKDSGAKLD
jgi:tripartite-type tricarboxylate transporter receptor subunit TctC